ncbi:MAG TPA: hypothetical protein PLL66_07175 [Bacteroidales bacterium]|nr:hypothetical protein [Bacteroidales bacterium]
MNQYWVKRILFILIFCVFGLSAFAQNSKQTKSLTKVEGFGIMYRLPGIWSGSVMSNTSAGSFNNWFVDLRPVSPTQISQFSMLDDKTVNNFSFFVVSYKGEKKIALRTEGCFANSCCITYEVIDSVNEAAGYYRFSDFVGGTKRAYTVFKFEDDQMVMEVYTSRFNKEKEPKLHTRWVAQLQDKNAVSFSILKFRFPKYNKPKDFTNAFSGMTESIFFTFENDPYKSEDQPFCGNIDINISTLPDIKLKPEDEIEILLTTQPLFDGIIYKSENLKFASKFVYLKGDTQHFKMKNVHPGKYYIYCFVDLDDDKLHLSGDLMCSEVEYLIEVPANGSAEYNAKIDFVIP